MLFRSDFVVLCTGELNENKNQKTLIAAAALLKDKIPHLKVLLGGNGPKEQELKAQVRELGLEDTVRLLGYRTDLEHIVPAVDVVVSCSRREGLPLNIVEAMLCKKPVVASVNRGHRELVKDGINGILLSPDDIAGYARAIETLSKDPGMAKAFGIAGQEIAEKYATAAVEQTLMPMLEEL